MSDSEPVVPIRARAKDSDQKLWQEFAKSHEFKSYSEWVRITLNKALTNNTPDESVGTKH